MYFHNLGPKSGLGNDEIVDYLSRRLRYGFLGVGESCGMLPIFSHVAEPIWVKLSRMIENRVQNDLAKEFVEKFEK